MVRLNRNSIQTTGKVDSVNIAFPERVFKETNPEDSGKRNIYSWKNIDNSVPAVILKLDHYQSLGIIRSLGKLKIPVYGIGISGISHSSLSRYCKKSFTIDMDNLGDEKLNNFLLNLADRLNKRPVLIPTTDETALFVARNSEQLRNHFIFSDSPADVISSFSNKKDCYFLARHYGIPTQKSIFPLTTNEVINFSREAVYPLVLKGIDGGKLEKKAGKKMVIVENRSELLSYYKLLEDRDYPNLIIQEYIPQDHNQMWIFNGYFDSHSNCKAAFTGIKIRQNPIYTGMTSFGVCRWNDKLIDLSSKLMKEVGYHGPVDIDFIYDKNDNTYKILDVNPRIGATFRMFVGKNGIDIARAMYLDLTGQQINFSRPEEERKWFVEDKDLLSSFRYYKKGDLKISEWIKSYKGIKEAGYYSAVDPIPFLYLWLHHLKKQLFKIFKVTKNLKVSSSGHAKTTTNETISEMEQQHQVTRYFDQNNNWKGDIYKTSEDPHALGVRRRIDYIFKTIDGKYNFKNKRALDIGCGPGEYLKELNSRGTKSIGIDLSREMLIVCRRNFSEKDNSALLSADVNRLPFENKSFGVVLCIGVLQYVLSVETAVSEINRITEPDGLVVICFENMMAATNIGYTILYWLKNIFRKNKPNYSGDSFSSTGVISKWFLNNVSVPHFYKLYSPWKFEKMIKRYGFKKQNGFTYGYPFKIFRKLKIKPYKSISTLEKSIESVMYKLRPSVISYTGEYYIGIFRKVSDLSQNY